MNDKWENWTCIPGRPCGGAKMMREAADEIERLRDERDLLRDFIGAIKYHLEWMDDIERGGSRVRDGYAFGEE